MGVVGAALGTAASYVVTSFVMAFFVTMRNSMLALHNDRDPFRWDWQYLRNAARISGPIAVQSVLMSGAQIVSTLIVAPLGNIAIAANSFAITAESLCYMPGYGIGDAATTLVGQTHGAGRHDLCRRLCTAVCRHGHARHGFHGCCHVCACARDDGSPHAGRRH